jgi:glycosyltransferase involved in cell wall biosynthesis
VPATSKLNVGGAMPEQTQVTRAPSPALATVAVMMGARNGERYLRQQIGTIARQRVGRIDLWISDDGSTDATRDIVAETAARWTRGVVHFLRGPQRGFAENFRSLMSNDAIAADYFCFSDQDDLWDEDKLSVAIDWLATQDPAVPALYCSRTLTVDREGVPIGMSPLFACPPSFRNALVQSIAGANTMVLNPSAHALVREASRRTGFVSHDWWCYLMVTGAGGVVHYSPEPRIAYRQHEGNLVGANNTWSARMVRLKGFLSGRFRDWNDRNLAALAACEDLLTDEARRLTAELSRARKGNLPARLGALRRSGVYRQSTLEQAMLYAACALNKI